MMALSELLQEFGSPIPGAEPVTLISESEREAQTVASYERGYTAGWEDAMAFEAAEKGRLGDALCRNLEDLSFTFAEARSQVLASVAPVFEALIDPILPELLRESAGPAILSELGRMAEEQADCALRLCVPPGQAELVRPLLTRAQGRVIELAEDPVLSDGQVVLRAGGRERVVDTARALAEIRAALEGFVHAARAEAGHV